MYANQTYPNVSVKPADPQQAFYANAVGPTDVSNSSSYNYANYYVHNAPNYGFLAPQNPDKPTSYYSNYYNSSNLAGLSQYEYTSLPNTFAPKEYDQSAYSQYQMNTHANTDISNQQYQQTKTDSTALQSTTPEKLMNDSGIDVISPQLSYTSFNSSSLSAGSNVTVEKPCTPPIAHLSHTAYNQTNAVVIEDSVDASNCSDDEEDEDDNDCDKENKGSKADKSDASAVKPPKPYLEIIADAILSCNVKMMQLHEIYGYMESKYAYFAKNINKSWRNSVRHNLSLNECFVKAGRGSNGKGNYWRIHPLVEKEFIRGNFRRKTFKKLIKAGSMNHQNGFSNNLHLTNPLDYCGNYRTNMSPFPMGAVSKFSSQFNSYAASSHSYNQ